METKDVAARLAAEVPKGVDDDNDETEDDSGRNGDGYGDDNRVDLDDGTVSDCQPGQRRQCPTVLMITLAVMMMVVAVVMMVMETVMMRAPARSEVEVPQGAQSFSQATVELPRSGSS